MDMDSAAFLIENDYLNQYVGLHYTLSSIMNGHRCSIQQSKVEKFWEIYGAQGLNSEIKTTEEDKKKIKELDDLADITNSVLATKPIDYKLLIPLIKKAYNLCNDYDTAFLDEMEAFFKNR